MARGQSIRAWACGCLIVYLGASASHAQPQQASPVCDGMLKVASSQVSKASMRTVAYYSFNSPDAVFSVRCDHGGDPELADLCETILNHSSHEFLNAFAYDVVECVRSHGSILSLRDSKRDSGLLHYPRSLIAMSGRVRGRNISLRARPDGGFELSFQR
jgi:hypothetical protein